MRTFMIPDILRSRFDRKQSEREAAAAKQETEAEKQRRQKAEIEDRQRKLIAASVDGDKIPAKDADWLAEQYESDLDFQRDAEAYLKARDAATNLKQAQEHDRIVQACRKRLVEIDERIGVHDYRLKTRGHDFIEKVRGSLVDRHTAAQKRIDAFIQSGEFNEAEFSESLAVVGEWETLMIEQRLLTQKADTHSQKFTSTLGRIDAEAMLVDPFSTNHFPLSFALAGSSDAVPLTLPKPSPCPLRAAHVRIGQEREAKQAKMDREQMLKDLPQSINRARGEAQDQNQPKHRREEAAARAERLERELASIS